MGGTRAANQWSIDYHMAKAGGGLSRLKRSARLADAKTPRPRPLPPRPRPYG